MSPPYQQRRGKNVTDAKGSVLLKVTLVAGGKPIRGNIVRSFTIPDAKVSVVAEHVRRALFGRSR